MSQRNFSYKFLPALATALCACSAQAANWHINFGFPVMAPAPIYVTHTVRPSIGFSFGFKKRMHGSATNHALHKIERDLAIVADRMRHAHCSHLRTLGHTMRTISNNWSSYAHAYAATYCLDRDTLEDIRDELSDVVYYLQRIENSGAHLNHYDYTQLHELTADLADTTAPYQRCRAGTMRDVAMHLYRIQRILADI